jgi:radical SAM family uncharacterized protein
VPAAATDNLAARVSNELLPFVEQPAQYVGGEVNQLVRPGDWERATLRLALAFPDAYSIGMSHLGGQILYWVANHTPGVCAERVYAPWPDAEQLMRQRRLPLFTWDTRQPVASADVFAFSLQYELCFTNVLNMLDLAGVPLRAADRTDAHPLVLAGGPQGDNPEPLADFLDLVVMGDGEPALAALLDAMQADQRDGVPRRAMIARLARRFPWLYAPGLYAPRYHADNTLAELRPLDDELPRTIARCRTPDFEHAPFPTRPLVPWTQTVHDRIAVEIMRGCPQICRFCHASYTKRPLTRRTVQRVLDIAEESYWATGHDEIALLSLSTADYPELAELAATINARFAPRHVNISLPSLRVDRMLANIPWMVSEVRKGSLTIAAEAARPEMRRALRKKVTDGDLLAGVRAAYEAGWKRVKLYFMAGLPGEQDADLRGIWELSYAVSQARRQTGKPPAAVSASVGWLVPKPFTPLQWAAQPRVDYFEHVRDVLYGMGRARRSAVKIQTHKPHASVLEAVLARGDRRLGPVIESAWRHGARFDGWQEHFNLRHWLDAFAETGVDPDFYAHRERPFDELLPWDHIGLHMDRGFLQRSYDDVYTQLGVSKPPPGILPPTPAPGA